MGVRWRGELSRPCQHFPIFTKLNPDDDEDGDDEDGDDYDDNDADDDYDDIFSLEYGGHQLAFLPLQLVLS